MKSLSSKTYQCGVTIQGLTTLSGTVYLTGITNTASWDHVIVGTTAQGQLYTRTYAQLMSDITSGIGLSGYVPTSRTLTINGVSYDLTANRSWTITTPYVSKLQHTVKAGVAINKGQAVYVTSADGTNMIVGLASNASEATSSKTMGLLDATVSTNGFANVVTEGLLDGLDTSTAGAAGDPVWLGTGGNLIYGLINKPYAPAHLVFIGIVTRKNSNNGEIFVKVQNGFELNEIHDVDLKTNLPVNGELLGFNGTLWVNKTIAGWLGYTPANASGTTNYISKFTGSTTLGNSQIYDDGSNVGIGTTTMYGKLSISSGNSNGIRIDTNGGGYSALNIGGTGALTVDAPGITGGRFQITDSGNVGIGTPSPSHNLHLYGAGDRIIKIENSGTYLMYAGLISNEGYIGSTNATPLGFYTNNVNRIYINTSGNVGIGTTTPSQKLDVNGYAKFTSGIILDGGATSHYREFIWNTSGFNRWDLYVHGAEPGSNVGGDLFLARYADNGAYLGNAVIFQRSTGNVGIGTTSPYSKLEITPSSVAWGEGIVINPASGYSAVFYRLEGAQGSNYTGTWAVGKAFSGDGGGELLQVVKNGLTGSAAYRVDASQQWKTNGDSIFGFNVGIGTTSPGNKLHIVGAANGSDAGNIRIDSTDQYGGLVINENTTFRTFLGYGNANHIFSNAQSDSTALRAANYLHLGASSVATITINASDNVGIGTTSPAYKLDVATGNDNAIRILNSSGSNNNGLALSVGSGTPWLDFYGGRFDIKYNTSPGSWNSGANTFLSILSSGNVGIGTTNPYEKLEVSGAISATGSVVGLSAQGHSTTLAVQSGISFLYAVDWGAEFKPLSVQAKTISLETGTGSTTSRLFIDNLGNVGIGTISPGTALAVNGGTAGQATVHIQHTSASGYSGIDFYENTGTHVGSLWHANSAGVGSNQNAMTLAARTPGDKVYIVAGGYDPATSGGITIDAGNVGIGTTTPSTKLDVSGVITATGGNSTNWNTAYGWGNHSSAGYVPQARTLTINGTSYDLSANRSWTIATTTPGGSDTQFQYNSSGSLAGASALTYNSTTNRVGINQASPGYDLDVNGQVRVQDKLRIGTGNGVVHMSSTATINPSATTVVWAQTVSVGMCAFIEYYILNNNSLTDQRAGTIMVTWNQSGTPTIAHTETTTPDIGSTTSVNFTSSLVGSDARINAVNSSANPYTIVMSYKYF